MKIKDKLPIIYHDLLSDIGDLPIEEEKYSDCNNCHHCLHKNSPTLDTKCCTFKPFIPNYMLGAILSDETKEGRTGRVILEKLICDKKNHHPLFLFDEENIVIRNRRRSKSHKNAFLNKEEAQNLLCDFFDNGKCSIWRYRSELCITYFCNPVNGQKGKDFWNAFQKFIQSVEFHLAIIAAEKSGVAFNNKLWLNQSNIKEAVTNQLEDLGQEFLPKHIDPIDYYISCFKEALKLKDLGSSPTTKMELLKKEMIEAHGALEGSSIPDCLLWNSHVKVEKQNDNYICTYNKIRLPLHQFEYLAFKQFDGEKSTYELLRNIALPISIKKLGYLYEQSFLLEANLGKE